MKPKPKKRKKKTISDRERVLRNLVHWFAREIGYLHHLPAVQAAAKDEKSLTHIHTVYREKGPQAGDYVLAVSSACMMQDHDFVFSQVIKNTGDHKLLGDKLVVRALGTKRECNYNNESFMIFEGIPEKLLWEGQQYKYAQLIKAAVAKLDTFIHRFRWLHFTALDEAELTFGEMFGGFSRTHDSIPYVIKLKLTPRTTQKDIIKEIKAQGFGTRKFEQVLKVKPEEPGLKIYNDFK